MIPLRTGDSKLVGHARRELEIAGLFKKNEEDDYDGFIGRGALALVKVFDDWAQDEPSRMSALDQVFSFLIHGDILTPPTNDPDEWEDFEVDGQVITRNKRNIFYVTRDEKLTWYNMRNQQKGICTDYLTGKPLEGVEDPNVERSTEHNMESTTNSSDAGDGADTQPVTEGEAEPRPEGGASVTEPTTGSDSGSVEKGELDPGVEPESSEASSEAQARKK